MSKKRRKSSASLSAPDLNKAISVEQAYALLGSLLASAAEQEPSDAKLGELLFAAAVQHNNLQHFGGQLSGDRLGAYAEALRGSLLSVEADSAKNAPVEKALHFVAAGESEKGGRFIREHLKDQATAMKAIMLAAKATADRASGAVGANREKRRNNAERDAAIRSTAQQLETGGMPRRNIPTEIERRLQRRQLPGTPIGRKAIKTLLGY